MRIPGTLPAGFYAADPVQQCTSLWGGSGGSFMIQRVCTLGSHTYLAPTIHRDGVPRTGPECFQTLSGHSPPYWRDKTVEIMWFGRQDLEALWPTWQQTPAGIQWAFVFSHLAQQFASFPFFSLSKFISKAVLDFMISFSPKTSRPSSHCIVGLCSFVFAMLSLPSGGYRNTHTSTGTLGNQTVLGHSLRSAFATGQVIQTMFSLKVPKFYNRDPTFPFYTHFLFLTGSGASERCVSQQCY
jgi:hypothetical protein